MTVRGTPNGSAPGVHAPMIGILHEALAAFSDAFDNDRSVPAADLVDWFSEWRRRARQVLTQEPRSPVDHAEARHRAGLLHFWGIMATYATEFSCLLSLGDAGNVEAADGIDADLERELEDAGQTIGFAVHHHPEFDDADARGCPWLHDVKGDGDPDHVVLFARRCSTAISDAKTTRDEEGGRGISYVAASARSKRGSSPR
jgi:hypothetical protein